MSHRPAPQQSRPKMTLTQTVQQRASHTETQPGLQTTKQSQLLSPDRGGIPAIWANPTKARQLQQEASGGVVFVETMRNGHHRILSATGRTEETSPPASSYDNRSILISRQSFTPSEGGIYTTSTTGYEWRAKCVKRQDCTFKAHSAKLFRQGHSPTSEGQNREIGRS